VFILGTLPVYFKHKKTILSYRMGQKIKLQSSSSYRHQILMDFTLGGETAISGGGTPDIVK